MKIKSIFTQKCNFIDINKINECRNLFLSINAFDLLFFNLNSIDFLVHWEVVYSMLNFVWKEKIYLLLYDHLWLNGQLFITIFSLWMFRSTPISSLNLKTTANFFKVSFKDCSSSKFALFVQIIKFCWDMVFREFVGMFFAQDQLNIGTLVHRDFFCNQCKD